MENKTRLGAERVNPFSASPVFDQVQKFFLENLLLVRFLCWRDISRDLFFRQDFELFFHIGVKKLVNQAINEIFRQMTITLTLPLDVPVRPMDAPVRPMDAKELTLGVRV